MLYITGKLMGASELEARGDFPASALVRLYDEGAQDVLNLVADRETYEQLVGLEPLTEVTLRLRWRRVDLGQFGGGKGRAYRLSVVGLHG